MGRGTGRENKKNGGRIYISIIFIVFCAALVASFFAPMRFFMSDNSFGAPLVRDDHESKVYQQRVAFLDENTFPYKESRIEYPPLGVAYLSIPALLSKSYQGFRNALIVQNLIFGFLLVVVAYKLLTVMQKSPRWLLLFLLPSFIYFTINRFDIFPVFLVLLALLYLFRHKFVAAFILLSLSFLVKGFSIILFPVFIAYMLSVRRPQNFNIFKNKYLYILLAPFVLITVLICIIAGVENGLFPYIYQSTRSFSYSSIYTMYLQALLGLLPSLAYIIIQKMLSFALVLLQIILPLLLYFGHQHFRKIIASKEEVIRWSIMVTMLFIFFSPYSSPQWFVWLLPLFVLNKGGRRLIALLIAFDIVNYLFFPVLYHYFHPYTISFSMITLLRTILFVLIFIQIAWPLKRSRTKALDVRESAHLYKKG